MERIRLKPCTCGSVNVEFDHRGKLPNIVCFGCGVKIEAVTLTILTGKWNRRYEEDAQSDPDKA